MKKGIEMEMIAKMKEALVKLVAETKIEDQAVVNAYKDMVNKMNSVLLVAETHYENKEIKAILNNQDNVDALISLPVVMSAMPEKFTNASKALFSAVYKFVVKIYYQAVRAENTIERKRKVPRKTKKQPRETEMWNGYWQSNEE